MILFQPKDLVFIQQKQVGPFGSFSCSISKISITTLYMMGKKKSMLFILKVAVDIVRHKIPFYTIPGRKLL